MTFFRNFFLVTLFPTTHPWGTFLLKMNVGWGDSHLCCGEGGETGLQSRESVPFLPVVGKMTDSGSAAPALSGQQWRAATLEGVLG